MTVIVYAIRSRLSGAIVLILMGLGACAPTTLSDEFGSHELSVKVERAPVVLRASRDYRNPNRWSDGEVTLDVPLAFVIPASIPVRQGNAGNHKTELWFQDAAGTVVNCDYRGGSDEPHPTSDYQRALGMRYVFERCSNGAQVGDETYITWLKLHVRVGDQQDPLGRTEVELASGGTGDLEPPLTPAESIQTRDAFSWERTQPVAEKNTEGYPALYYALIYLEDRDQLAALDDLLIHHDGLPLFAEELERWKGQQGFFQHEWDGKGIFRFGLVPGAIYNRLRQAALDGNVIFRAVVLRDIPTSARGRDGSISYAALRASGFLYRGEGPAASAGSKLHTAKQELFGIILREVVKVIAEVAESVVNEVREGIGAVDRLSTGSIVLTVNLHMLNVDPAFQVGTPMQRAWGPGTGNPVLLPGVKVMARQRQLAGPLSTLFSAQTGADGIARIEVAKGLETSFCVAVESDAAEVSNYLTEIEYCNFPVEKPDKDTDVHLPLQHQYFNILAQASEGRQYLMDVVHFTPHQAFILVGPLTWPFGVFSGAITPCFGLPNLPAEAVVETVFAAVCAAAGATYGPQAAALAAAACLELYPLYPGVDIVIAERDSINAYNAHYDAALDSRLTTTHEYGHFALCSMLFKKDPVTYMSAYSSAMLSRMDPDPDETNVAGYINEGFADFFASQVAGGTNYFASPDDYQAWSNNYCDSTTSSCLDQNPGISLRGSNYPKFTAQAARVASTLHDAFDSWQPDGGIPVSNKPGNGNPWMTIVSGNPSVTQLIKNPNPAPDANDEAVRLSGESIYSLMTHPDFIDNFLDWLSDKSVMGGLSDIAKEAGFSWCDRCRLFAINDKNFVQVDIGTGKRTRIPSPDMMDFHCKQQPISDWLGPKPASDLSCSVVAIAGTVLRNGVPVNDVPVTLTLESTATTVRSGVNGTFRFDSLEAGKHYLLTATAQIEGVEYSGSATVRAAAGLVKDVAILLAPASGGGGGNTGNGDGDICPQGTIPCVCGTGGDKDDIGCVPPLVCYKQCVGRPSGE